MASHPPLYFISSSAAESRVVRCEGVGDAKPAKAAPETRAGVHACACGVLREAAFEPGVLGRRLVVTVTR
jgi:hypothetical protein